MEEESEKREKESPQPQIDPEWYVRHPAPLLSHRPLSGPSIRDDSEVFLPPVENGDDRLDFYVMYRKAASRYDIDYTKRRHEDLNTVLIFVRSFDFLCVLYLTFTLRPVCSAPLVRPSSSTSTRCSNPIRLGIQ